MVEREKEKDRVEEKGRRRKKSPDLAVEKVKSLGRASEGSSMDSVSLEAQTTLLSDAHLSQSINTEQRASLIGELQRKYGNIYVQRLLSQRAIQPKFTVSSPDDEQEQEAERMASMIVPAPGFQMQRQLAEEEEEVRAKLQRQEAPGEEEEVRLKAAARQVAEVPTEVETRIKASEGGGQPLPDSIRNSFEPQFGHDFSEVRVHTDTEASELSQEIGARAFTTGHDIFFKEGEYQPESESGQRLIAHEITHVVQQGAAAVSQKRINKKEAESIKLKETKSETEKSKETVADKKLSGKDWCDQFKGSTSIDDLESGFKSNVTKFISAIEASGGKVTPTATKRPPERAFLMHWAWQIVFKNQDPRKVPAKKGVDINWWHGTLEESKSAAQEMVDGYKISNLKTAPALKSKHISGKAIDMIITLKGDLKIKDVSGKEVSITTEPRDHTNSKLIEVGASYGVIHFKDVNKDKVHWSDDGK